MFAEKIFVWSSKFKKMFLFSDFFCMMFSIFLSFSELSDQDGSNFFGPIENYFSFTLKNKQYKKIIFYKVSKH